MNASQLALELEGKFKTINYFVAHGNYSNSFCDDKVGDHLDSVAQPYLDLIPAIEALAAKIKDEVNLARARES